MGYQYGIWVPEERGHRTIYLLVRYRYRGRLRPYLSGPVLPAGSVPVQRTSLSLIITTYYIMRRDLAPHLPNRLRGVVQVLVGWWYTHHKEWRVGEIDP